MLKSTGYLKYSDNPYRLIVLIDGEISRYYRSLLPKIVTVSIPMHSPHISVIRRETPIWKDFWGAYENELIEFEYDPFIYMDEIYCWFKCWSKRLCDIRGELGLDRFRFITKLDGDIPSFHVTIGNFK